MTRPKEISKFLDLLSREWEGVKIDIDSPRDPRGEWWIDIGDGDFQSHVSWKPAFGFGIFTSDKDDVFADRPDEIYRTSADACARICQMKTRWPETDRIHPMRLKDLRHIVGTPQVRLAAALQVNQAAVSRMENRGDMHISSLAEYIEAMGGELELRAKFEKFEVRIEPSGTVNQKVRR